MNKLIVCIMGQNCEKFLPMCLESVKDADEVVFCEGLEKGLKEIQVSKSLELFKEKCPSGLWIGQVYYQEVKEMNGNQRNFYLKYLKEYFPNDWCLCLDADEVCADLSKIKEFIQVGQPGLYSVKMRHFEGDLGHEDATVPEHFVLNRLFKISEAGSYPECEHPVLNPRDLKEGEERTTIGLFRGTTIWHLAYCPNIWSFKKRYENHLKKSEMHTPEYLKNWYFAHLFGSYPKNGFNLIDIPNVILKEFGIEPDEIYFATHTQIEIKHFIMMKQWLDFASQKIQWHYGYNPKILDVGCGVGIYGYVAQKFLNCDWNGFELSQWAVKKNPYGLDNLKQGNILTTNFGENKYDLVMVIDILEHLNYEELDKALENIKNSGELFIFSMPFRGDPNLDADPTHKIKESKEWWINKLLKYFKVYPAPNDWIFNNQLLIGEKL